MVGAPALAPHNVSDFQVHMSAGVPDAQWPKSGGKRFDQRCPAIARPALIQLSEAGWKPMEACW
jgi:hypothetical protein